MVQTTLILNKEHDPKCDEAIEVLLYNFHVTWVDKAVIEIGICNMKQNELGHVISNNVAF